MADDGSTAVLEIGTYKLRPGTRDEFDRIFPEGAGPMLHQHGVAVVHLGPVALFRPARSGVFGAVGEVYHALVALVCASAVVIVALDPARLWWFVPIAAFSYGLAFAGRQAVRRQRPGWRARHLRGTGGSYVALVTAVVIVSATEAGPIVWFTPVVVGTALVVLACRRVRDVAA